MIEPTDHEAVLAFLNDDLSKEQQEIFVGRLRLEPELVQLVLALAGDDDLLREWAMQSGNEPDNEFETARDHVVDEEETEDKTPATRHRSPSTAYNSLAFVRNHNFAVAVSVAFVAIGALVAWMAVTYLPGIAKQDTGNEPVVEVKHVALLRTHQDVEWADKARPASNGTRLVPGDRLAIASGLVEIKYFTGASVVIEGPAEFWVGGTEASGTKAKREEKIARSSGATHEATASGRSPRKLGGRSLLPHASSLTPHPSSTNSGFLKLGRLVARCETFESKGFTIVTPAARVEDLGTEFAVAVADDQRTQVHVVRGKVRLAASSGDAPPVILSDGQSASAEAGAPPRVEPLAGEFAQEIESIRRRLTRIEAFEGIASKLPYEPLADDLVAGLTPTSSIKPRTPLVGLTDGQTTPRLGRGPDGRVFVDADEPWTLTFDLAESVAEDARATSRWSIHEVRVFSYNTDARVFQDYDVEVSVDGQTWETIERNIRNARRGREMNLPAGVEPDYYHDYSVTRLTQRDGGQLTETSRYVRLRFYGVAERNEASLFSRASGFHHSSLYEIDVLGAVSSLREDDTELTTPSAKATQLEEDNS
ncbi:MAG: FecR domain-containing protein [Pirellulales bacterium]|nr:FecR domain-containing protein [Pirellulales bacterium]